MEIWQKLCHRKINFHGDGFFNFSIQRYRHQHCCCFCSGGGGADGGGGGRSNTVDCCLLFSIMIDLSSLLLLSLRVCVVVCRLCCSVRYKIPFIDKSPLSIKRHPPLLIKGNFIDKSLFFLSIKEKSIWGNLNIRRKNNFLAR